MPITLFLVTAASSSGDVSGFSTALGLIEIELPIVSGAITYDHPTTGKVYILVFHQAIYCCQMDNYLICPMQCCVNGVVINSLPAKSCYGGETP